MARGGEVFYPCRWINWEGLVTPMEEIDWEGLLPQWKSKGGWLP